MIFFISPPSKLGYIRIIFRGVFPYRKINDSIIRESGVWDVH